MPSIKEIRKLGSKKRRDVFYQISDFLAYYPAKLFLYTPITPNQITILWIVVEIVASLFLITGKKWIMIGALLIFQSMFIIDCTDGIVARYKKKFSLNGVYLDLLGHYSANSILLICYSIGIAKMFNQQIYILFGIITVFAFLLNKSVTLNPTWYPEKQSKYIIKNSKESMLLNEKKFMYYVFAFFRVEYLFNAMFWGTLFGIGNIVVIVYMILFILEFFRKILKQYTKNYQSDKILFKKE